MMKNLESLFRNMREIELSGSELKLIERIWGKETAFNVSVYSFYYDSDGREVKGFLAYPKKIQERLPVIIWNRGGSDKTGLIDNFLAKGLLAEIASWGYIVLASQYRKDDGFGGNDVNDILNLIELSDKLELADSSRIGMEGWSRGGMMSYIVLTKTDRIKCCVIVAGLADLIRNEKAKNKLDKVLIEKIGGGNEEEFLKKKKERSAVNFYSKISKATNVLFIHGTSDEKILQEDSVDMYVKLSSANPGTEYELKLIQGGDHYLRKNRKEVSVIRKSWFDKYLKFNC